MSTLSLVRVAIVASLATTGGAIYYRLSDGGDPEVARKKVEEKVNKLEREMSKFSETGVAFVQRLKALASDAQKTASGDPQPAENVKSQNNEPFKPQDGDEKTLPPLDHPPEGAAYPFCHTCSGPRIWFFAEKLRLKRRFTPYPDPPRE